MPVPKHKEWVHFDKAAQNFAVPLVVCFMQTGKKSLKTLFPVVTCFRYENTIEILVGCEATPRDLGRSSRIFRQEALHRDVPDQDTIVRYYH